MSIEFEKWKQLKGVMDQEDAWEDLVEVLREQDSPEDFFGFKIEATGEERDEPVKGDAVQSNFYFAKVDGTVEIRLEIEHNSWDYGEFEGPDWISPVRSREETITVTVFEEIT